MMMFVCVGFVQLILINVFFILGIGNQLRAAAIQPIERVVDDDVQAPLPAEPGASSPSHEFVFAMGNRMDAYRKMDNENKMQAVRLRIVHANDRNMFSSIKTFAMEGERLLDIRKKAMFEAGIVAKQVRNCCFQ